jgi:Icc-related predicted phosphoesterase
MRIVCISDTHTRHGKLTVPDGDVLVHAGDFTGHGHENEVRRFDAWLGSLPHRHKVVIAGNHDFCFENDPIEARSWLQHCTYLEDSGVDIDGLKFWGSPWQPRFFDWAFNLDRGAALAAKWALIPADTDVLITHGPPYGILDKTSRQEPVGCMDLLDAIERIRPRLHVFGHIHEAYGIQERGRTRFVNASACDLRYAPVQAPIVVDL